MRPLRTPATIALSMAAIACLLMPLPAPAAAKAKAKATAKTTPKAKAKEAESAPAASEMPWTLRDHYRITVGKSTFCYAVANSEWRVLVEGMDVVVDDVKFLITLADGTTLDAPALGEATTNRKTFTDTIGDGTCYWTEYPAKDGLVVRHNVRTYASRPCILISVAIGNTGDKPVEIAKISPVIVGPGGIHNLSSDAGVASRRMALRGRSPVYDPTRTSLTVFHDRKNDFCLSIGVLPQGTASTNAQFEASTGAWQGEIASTYTPPVRLDPGAKMESDACWLSLGVPAPWQVDMYYSWAVSLMPGSKMDAETPRSWVTVDSGAAEADLYAAIKEWAGAGVSHALVPPDWEGRPGSLEGAVPRFPKSMGKVAAQIRSLGLKSGLPVDPMSMAQGGAVSAASSDGRRWTNLSAAEGRKNAIDRMKKINGWGFDFYVVRPSDVPDEVLKQFNMTRAQADYLAFSVMLEAAGGRPVLPSSSATAKPNLDEWLEAAACSSRMAEFGVIPGPVRLNADAGAMDDTLLAAMTFFNGPIEFVGAPRGDAARQCAQFLTRPKLYGHPLDAQTSPKLWQTIFRSADNDVYGSALAVFPGANPWGLAMLEADKDKPVYVWRADDGQVLDLAQGKAPAADRLTMYGVAPVLQRPAIMGASLGLGLLLDDLKDLKWAEDKGILSGGFVGKSRDAATAYVNVPPGWTLKSGKAGDAAIKKTAGDRLQFTVKPGVPTNFQLEFTRQ